MTGERQVPDVLFGADSGQVRDSIAAAVRIAVNEAAHSIQAVREWCDRAEADMRKSIKTAPATASGEVFAYSAGLMKAVHDVRKLLPPVPTVSGEDVVSEDRDL